MPDISNALEHLNTSTDASGAINQGALSGYDLGQKLATLHALQGVDLNEPATINNALQSSIHAGALEQAGALLNLNLTRMKIAGAQRGLNALTGAPVQDPSSDAQASPADTPASSQPDPRIAHMQDSMNLATQAIADIKAAPPELRAAAFHAARQQFIDRGVPTEAIDAVGAHLADQNFSDESLDDLTDHYQGHSANLANVAAGGQPDPQAPSHPTNSWGMDLLNDPSRLADLGWLKSVGYDPETYLTAARVQAAPALAGQTAQAEIAPHLVQHAGEQAINAGFENVTVPEMGPNGQPTGRMVTTTKAHFLAPVSQGGMGGSAAALSPRETAAQSARGTTEETPATIKGPGNEDVHGFWTTQNGHRVFREAGMASGDASTRGPTTGDITSQTHQAAQAAEILKPDPAARNQAVDTEASSQRALSIIGAMKFDNTTPIKAQIARALRTAGLGGAEVERYATDTAGFQALATQALTGGAHQAFPTRTTDRDLKLMQQVFPTLTTPNDQASTAFGMQAAQARRTQQWEDFKANYSGDKADPNAVYRAWLAGPGGQSIYQNPVWSHVPIGGRPAFNPATDIKTVNGVRVGAWGIGTGHPVYFPVH